jgi:hypothetical protein
MHASSRLARRALCARAEDRSSVRSDGPGPSPAPCSPSERLTRSARPQRAAANVAGRRCSPAESSRVRSTSSCRSRRRRQDRGTPPGSRSPWRCTPSSSACRSPGSQAARQRTASVGAETTRPRAGAPNRPVRQTVLGLTEFRLRPAGRCCVPASRDRAEQLVPLHPDRNSISSGCCRRAGAYDGGQSGVTAGTATRVTGAASPQFPGER